MNAFMRVLVVVLLVAGCDRVFGLTVVPDAPPVPDAPLPDAPDPARLGCADQSREAFADPDVYPNIAACEGAWSVAGLRAPVVSCARRAGNQGEVPSGTGCSAADLCEQGWHVCQQRIDVLDHLPVDHRSCADIGAPPSTFFASGQGGASGDCSFAPDTDDFQGCGSTGGLAAASCAPLDKTTGNACMDLLAGGWNCPSAANTAELLSVTKTDPLAGGGVLCCRDAIL